MRWEGTQMCATDPLTIWESDIAYRRYICAHVPRRIDANDSIASTASARLSESVFDMHFKLADIALKQNNVELADRTMAYIKSHLRNEVHDKRSAQWGLLNGKSLVLKSQLATVDPARSLKLLVDAWQQGNAVMRQQNELLTTNPDIYINFMERFAEIGGAALVVIGKCDANINQHETGRIIELTRPSTKGKSNFYLFALPFRRR